MNKTAGVVAVALVLSAIGIGTTGAYPTPKILSPSWELEIQLQPPVAIEVVPPGQTQAKVFWYIVYKVTNSTGEDQLFVPDFLLYTATGQALRAGDNVPETVFKAIQHRHNEPLLQNKVAMTGKLLQGSNNARLGVAIWPDFDPEAGAFSIFVGGLSGEQADIKLPRPITVKQTDPSGKVSEVVKTKVTLFKTRQLMCRVAGTAANRHRAPIQEVMRRWIMR